MNVRAPAKIDEWLLTSMSRGIQIQKNGRNVLFSKSFDKAWEFVKNQGSSGDHITIIVDGMLDNS